MGGVWMLILPSGLKGISCPICLVLGRYDDFHLYGKNIASMYPMSQFVFWNKVAICHNRRNLVISIMRSWSVWKNQRMLPIDAMKDLFLSVALPRSYRYVWQKKDGVFQPSCQEHHLQELRMHKTKYICRLWINKAIHTLLILIV